jgi:hypothetical protein
MTDNSSTARLLQALKEGEELTTRQISNRFGIANARDVVYNLRQNGYAVNIVERVNSKGMKKFKYTLGSLQPSTHTYTVKGVGG